MFLRVDGADKDAADLQVGWVGGQIPVGKVTDELQSALRRSRPSGPTLP